jgi:hypothetical protein
MNLLIYKQVVQVLQVVQAMQVIGFTALRR